MINPWNQHAIPQNAAMQVPHPLPQLPNAHMHNPLAMVQPPLGSLRPRTSTFMPGTGKGASRQAHPYLDTTEKPDQAKRNNAAPNLNSYSGEGLQR